MFPPRPVHRQAIRRPARRDRRAHLDYHYQLERLPRQPTLSCGLGEPSCAQAVFTIFGYVSVPLMALAAFLLVITLLVLAHEQDVQWTDDESDGRPESVSRTPDDSTRRRAEAS